MPTFPASLTLACGILDRLQAADPKILDLRDVSTLANYFLIATGTSSPHLKALADELERGLKEERIRPRRKAGGYSSGWVIMDFGEVIVHLMTADLREFYALEQLWSDGKTLAIPTC
jgi:ribosome-associated protein